jgi:hypothetical protein
MPCVPYDRRFVAAFIGQLPLRDLDCGLKLAVDRAYARWWRKYGT